MKFGTEFEKLVLRACGHREAFGFGYVNQKQRYQQEVRAALTICGPCRLSIQTISAEACAKPCSSAENLSKRLPELLGREAQVRWADSIRKKACAYYFPLLEVVTSSSVQPNTGIRNILRLLFSIQSASFWIDSRSDLMTSGWLVAEVEMLVRGSDFGAQPPGKSSAYGYWRRIKPELLSSARRTLSAAPEAA
jgi:hypothetical protein